MEGAKKYLCADLSLEIPGLNQKFRLYREQFGRHITGINDIWYRPTYEVVYTSEPQWDGKYLASRSMTKLIFSSDAKEDERPLGVREMLAAVPADMLRFLVRTLNDRWAVVTFVYNGTETEYTINFDKSELWEQEESIMNATYFAMDEELKALGPYKMVENGTAERVPGSLIGEYPVPQEGVFWVIDEKIVAVKEPWDWNSESPAALFDHQKQWAKLSCEVTQGKPFDHYPRGQVQIKNCRATVLCHHSLIHSPYPFVIASKFQIPQMNTRFLAYGYPKEYADQLYKD
jgi:hypothetical protein